MKVQEYLNENYPCACNSRYHQENCPQKNLEELNLRNLNLEGDLDLKEFYNLKKIYLTGNPQLGEIKNKPYRIRLICQNPTEWLNHQYPNKEKVKEIRLIDDIDSNFELGEMIIDNFPHLENLSTSVDTYFDSIHKITKVTISNCPKLEEVNIGDFVDNKELILTNLPNLKYLDCSKNELATLDLTNLSNLKGVYCSSNSLAEIKLPTSAGEKLTDLTLAGNNFNQDLTFISHLINLENLELGINKFKGSLEFLKNMDKLQRLYISDTDIDSGLEYLPESVWEFECFADSEDVKCKVLYNLLENTQGKNTSQKLQEIKQKAKENARKLLKDELQFRTHCQILLEQKIKDLEGQLIFTVKQKIDKQKELAKKESQNHQLQNENNHLKSQLTRTEELLGEQTAQIIQPPK